jgi:uncharacterized protein (TIGR03435 family)
MRAIMQGLLILAASSICQTKAQLFEVTSITPLAEEHAEFGCSPDGRFVSSGSLRQILTWAYDVENYQLAGAPDWDPAIIFRIEAKASDPTALAVCKVMVRNLLADRFKLAVHREMRETPVFALVAGENGSKLAKASGEDFG